MDFRLLPAIFLGKLTRQLIKLKGGGATTAPGLFSRYLHKNLLKRLTASLDRLVLVSGTNGKTTTARIMAEFLRKEGIDYVHNRHGSNLERGLITALLEKTSYFGRLRTKTGIFEVDEAVLGTILPRLAPQVIVLTNLFRDQLDRYGEVDNIKRLWEKALDSLDDKTILVINADDPSLAFLGKKAKGKVYYFGLDAPKVALEKVPHAVDSSKCPDCRHDLTYRLFYSSHQGDYFCQKCGFRRPKLDFFASDISFEKDKTKFTLNLQTGNKVELQVKLPGIFNVYNYLAAFSSLIALGFSSENFSRISNDFDFAFGRGETLEIDGRRVVVALAKNPTGFNEIIRTFLNGEKQVILFLINDKIADGRDVSWLWDVDFEILGKKDNRIFVSGLRGADLVLRLKYAAITDTRFLEKLNEGFELALRTTVMGQTLTIVPTYTAMIELKKLLSKKKISAEFWED